jgi:hypothetical protein
LAQCFLGGAFPGFCIGVSFGFSVVFDGTGVLRDGEIEALGGGGEVADDICGSGAGLDSCGVGGGELEAVEKRGGAFGVEAAGCDGIDDHRERELDRFGVFEREQLEVLAGDEIAAADIGKTEPAMLLMKTVVKVAPLVAG